MVQDLNAWKRLADPENKQIYIPDPQGPIETSEEKRLENYIEGAL